MDKIIELAQDLEKIVLVFTNIILAIYSIYSTVKARRWRQTADFVGNCLVQEEKETSVKGKSKIKEKLAVVSPKILKSYVRQVKMD